MQFVGAYSDTKIAPQTDLAAAFFFGVRIVFEWQTNRLNVTRHFFKPHLERSVRSQLDFLIK